MNTFAKKLKELDGAWKDVKGDQDQGFKNMKDGTYDFLLCRAEIGESKNESNPRLQVAWEFKCIKGKAINQRAYAYDGLDAERGLNAIKGRLLALKVKPPRRIQDLPESLEKALDRKCRCKLTTRGKFQNLIILKRLKDKDKEVEEGTDEGL